MSIFTKHTILWRVKKLGTNIWGHQQQKLQFKRAVEPIGHQFWQFQWEKWGFSSHKIWGYPCCPHGFKVKPTIFVIEGKISWVTSQWSNGGCIIAQLLRMVEIAYNSTVYMFFLNGTCFILSNPHMKRHVQIPPPSSPKKTTAFLRKRGPLSSSLISEVIDIRRMAAEWQMFFLHLFAHFWMKSR